MKRIGRIGAKPLEDLADRAALFICELGKPKDYALTLSPEGNLALERSAEAAEDDVIGHYDPNQYRVPRWIGLGKQIREDLHHEVTLRLATTDKA